jgi:hypothetical protein
LKFSSIFHISLQGEGKKKERKKKEEEEGKYFKV